MVGHDQIPARLAPPSGFRHCAVKRDDAPWDLRVRHEIRLFRSHVARKAGGKLGFVEH
jgi:hypothetical protein